jgi:hypothetical protein
LSSKFPILKWQGSESQAAFSMGLERSMLKGAGFLETMKEKSSMTPVGLCELCNMLMHIFWFPVKLIKGRDKSLAWSSAIGGAQSITKSIGVEKKKHNDAESRGFTQGLD